MPLLLLMTLSAPTMNPLTWTFALSAVLCAGVLAALEIGTRVGRRFHDSIRL